MRRAFGLSAMGTSPVPRVPRMSLFSGGYEADPDTVLLLKCDEGEGTAAADFSDYHNHGAIESARWDTGRYGYGLRFDGINDRIIVPHSPTLELSEFCIEAWVWIEYDGAQRIIEKPGSYFLMLSQSGVKNRQVRFGAGIWTGGALQQVATGWNYGIEGWLHVAFQRDQSGYLSLAVNGVEDAVSPFTTGIPDTSVDDLLIGCGESGYFFQGIMDEVRISNIYRPIPSLDPNR
jgi:Concanavalin A-like lectin/glucanases superfamily